MLLAGDIGGTKALLALFPTFGKAADESLPAVEQRTYSSRHYRSLDHIIETFLAETGADVTSAGFGVAGPVLGNKAEATNLSWTIDGQAISQRFGFPVRLINDLEAIATAVPRLQEDDLVMLNQGNPPLHGAIGVVAPGTGLGEAFLVWNGNRYEPHPSEGGHTAFGPTTIDQLDLLNYWLPRMSHVSYERVCSGLGIPNIYTFFRETGRYEEPDWLGALLREAGDPTPIIVEAAVAQTADICVATLDMFMEILGDEAGNLALTVLATGGIYLGGGIPPRIVEQLKAGPFLDFFCDKGRFTEAMADIPIYIITHPHAALLGAASAVFGLKAG